MQISEKAVDLPKLVILVSVLVAVIGFAAVFTLPKERSPRIKLPVILVAVPNPGASPTTNETQIIEKIEDEVGTSLSHLKSRGGVHGQAISGVAVMEFVFDDNIQVSEAKRDVESLINRVKGQFPRDAQQDPGPIVNDLAFDNFPVIQVFIAGGEDGEHRRKVAEELQTQIQKLPGVAGVDIYGGLEKEIQIELDPNIMALYGFSYQQIEGAIRLANAEAPTGAIETGSGSDQRVRAQGRLTTLQAIQELPLGARDGRPVALGDVADVSMGHKQRKTIARYGGRDAVVLLARAKTDIDVLATANAIQQLVQEYRPPAGGKPIELGTVRSQGREIHYMLKMLLSNAAYGIVLVVIVLWVGMGWRNASLISLAIPMSIVGAAAIMWFMKHSFFPDVAINNMSLFAMILVGGMVVDGCIIAGENIYRHRELGRSPVEAAKRGIREVGASLLGAYTTTFASFAPLFLVRGVMGSFMEVLPLVVMLCLGSAILVDHFLLPVLSVPFMKVPPGKVMTNFDKNLSPEELEIAQAAALAGSTPIRRFYGRALAIALQHRVMVLCLTIVLSLTPMALFATGAVGVEFFPESDVPVIEVYFELPLGSSMEGRTVEIAKKIEESVLQAVRHDEWYLPPGWTERVKPVTTIGEPGALNTRLDLDFGSGPEYGMVYVELALAEDRERTAAQIRQAIVDHLPPLPGVNVQVRSPKEGPPSGAPVAVRVMDRKDSSTTIEELAARAAQVEQILRRIPGTFDVTSDYRVRPELLVTPNRTVASLFGIDTNQIVASLNYALEGVRVGEVDFGGSEQFDMRLRNKPTDRDQIEDLANLPLHTSSGKIVTLDQVASVERVDAANTIRHYEQHRMIQVRAELEEGVLPDNIKAALLAALQPQLTDSQRARVAASSDLLFSDDQTVVEFGGETEMRDEAQQDLKMAMLVSLAAMLIILIIQFNNFTQSLITLFSVPMSFAGVGLGLALAGFNFSVAAMIGVVALSGVVVDTAIVLIDFINRLHKVGIPLDRAVIYAGQLRLRPISLTVVTTIAGLLPNALNLSGGGEFFQPLAITFISGLALATLLQLFVVPVACHTFGHRPTKAAQPSPHPTPQPAVAAAG